MRRTLIALAVAVGVGLSGLADAAAMTIDGAAIRDSLDASSPVAKTRLFCFDKYSGRFLYWGPCHASYPRVYCRNRYTGQFLYWGSCRSW
jgi:hypothetical protein